MDGERVFIVCFLFAAIVGVCAGSDELVAKLTALIENEQMTENKPFRGLGQWQEMEGNFNNYMFMNFHGGFLESNIRKNGWIPDINGYISPYVEHQMFEATKFANAERSSQIQVERLARMLQNFHDTNRPNTSLYCYYPQYYNETSDFWVFDASNLDNAIAVFDQFLPLSELLLGSAPLPDGFAEMFTPRAFAERNTLTPDFDISSIYLQFGAQLYAARDTYPVAWKEYKSYNQNIPSVFTAMKKYAYRPFSTDRNQNTIDPRSYYFIREFLDEAKIEGRDIALMPTYMQLIDELKVDYYKKRIMPFYVNNLDLTVHASVIGASYLAFSSGLVEKDLLLNDPDLQLIYESTFALMIHELKTNVSSRPDLSLLYYPSPTEFYWFIARTLMHMEMDITKGPLVTPMFETFYHDLKEVMKTKVTDTIMAARQTDVDGRMFYDDFIGGDDLTWDNKPLNRAQDRVFTTGMAVTVLTYTWSTYDHVQKKVVWRPETPAAVRETVNGCADWLEENALTGEYALMCPFFSWDVKGRSTVHYLYPANRFEFLLNGTKVNQMDYVPKDPTIYAMEGYVDPAEYDILLKMDKFGEPTPLTFDGYNEGQGTAVVWTVDAFTYSTIRLAVSMRDALEN